MHSLKSRRNNYDSLGPTITSFDSQSHQNSRNDHFRWLLQYQPPPKTLSSYPLEPETLLTQIQEQLPVPCPCWHFLGVSGRRQSPQGNVQDEFASWWNWVQLCLFHTLFLGVEYVVDYTHETWDGNEFASLTFEKNGIECLKENQVTDGDWLWTDHTKSEGRHSNLLPILRNTSIGDNNVMTTGNFLCCTSCCLGIGGWIELDDMNTGIYGR